LHREKYTPSVRELHTTQEKNSNCKRGNITFILSYKIHHGRCGCVEKNNCIPDSTGTAKREVHKEIINAFTVDPTPKDMIKSEPPKRILIKNRREG
jgi:hypothetical protein